MSAQRALTRARAPDERGAEQRAWMVVRSAYLERQASPQRQPRGRLTLALAAAMLVAALALSPAGATVGRLITRALGVQHAAPRLFPLPAPGRLLVSGRGGTWTVAANGATRRLGPWSQASWSPHGVYVAVTGGNRLTAIDSNGNRQWELTRARARNPAWYAPTGYRVAYLSGDALRVVAGDGTSDHPLAAGVAGVAPAWRPAQAYQLVYMTRQGRLVVRDGDTGQGLWSSIPGGTIRQLAWSADGRQLLALSSTAARVYRADGGLTSTIALPRDAPAINGGLSPDGRTLALILGGSGSGVALYNLATRTPMPDRLLSGAGLRQVLWSPDGRWLLVSWPVADQWVFLRVTGTPRIAAVSHIAQQFSAGGARRGFPQLDSWCCTSGR